MIIQSQVHLSPELTVLIDGVPVHYRYIQRIEHSMEPDHHDMVLMHVTGLPPRAVRDYRNAPVTYTGRLTGGYTESFFGYIIDVHLETATAAGTVNNSPLQSATLVCMGMSYDLRGEKHKSWDGYRLQDVVAVLSAQHGFSYDVPDDPLLYSPMIQDAESDWQFVVRYAKMLGYETTMHGTHLHIFDPYKAFSRGISYHRLTSHRDIPKLMTQNPGNVLSFKAQMGERHPDGVYKDTAISVHQDDGYVYDLRLSELRGLKQPGKYSNRLLDSVDNYDQAVRSINAHRKGIYDFTACATVLGIPGCRPGGIVQVEGYGSEDTDGYWYVKGVKHDIHTKAFTTELELVRNKESQLVRSSVSAYSPPPTARLIDGKWLASQRRTNVYG